MVAFLILLIVTVVLDLKLFREIQRVRVDISRLELSVLETLEPEYKPQ